MCGGVLQEQGKNTFTHMLKISIKKMKLPPARYQLSRGAQGVSALGGCLLPGWCLLRGGCVWSGGVSAPGGCLVWGVFGPGGCLLLGVSALEGGCLLPGVPGQALPPVDRQCKHIMPQTSFAGGKNEVNYQLSKGQTRIMSV